MRSRIALAEYPHSRETAVIRRCDNECSIKYGSPRNVDFEPGWLCCHAWKPWRSCIPRFCTAERFNQVLMASFLNATKTPSPRFSIAGNQETSGASGARLTSSTRRGYETWLNNHLIPKWGDCELADLQPRPVEMWLDSLALPPKSKVHIRGLLHVLIFYGIMRCGAATFQPHAIQWNWSR